MDTLSCLSTSLPSSPPRALTFSCAELHAHHLRLCCFQWDWSHPSCRVGPDWLKPMRIYFLLSSVIGWGVGLSPMRRGFLRLLGQISALPSRALPSALLCQKPSCIYFWDTCGGCEAMRIGGYCESTWEWSQQGNRENHPETKLELYWQHEPMDQTWMRTSHDNSVI